MNVHGLDDLSLLGIFNRLPPLDLFVAGQVCGRWLSFRAKSAATRRSLILLIGGSGLELALTSIFTMPQQRLLKNADGSRMFPSGTARDTRNVVAKATFNSNYAHWLADLFSGVTNFVVSIRIKSVGQLVPIVQMLMLLSPTLVSLKIVAQYINKGLAVYDGANWEVRPQLLRALNGLRVLKQLELCLDFALARNQIVQLDLPVLAQLQTFNFYTDDDSNAVFDSLVKYADANEQLKTIGMHATSTILLDKWFTLSSSVSSRIAHLNVNLKQMSLQSFDRLSDHFASLTTLVLALPSFFEAYVFNIRPQIKLRSLVPLTQLVHLVVQTDAAFIRHDTLFITDPDQYCPPLTSVKVFTLQIDPSFVISHDFFVGLNYHLIFPNLQVVQLLRADDVCDWCKGLLLDSIENCVRALLRPFLRCVDLIVAKSNNPDRVWSRDELNVEFSVQNSFTGHFQFYPHHSFTSSIIPFDNI